MIRNVRLDRSCTTIALLAVMAAMLSLLEGPGSFGGAGLRRAEAASPAGADPAGRIALAARIGGHALAGLADAGGPDGPAPAEAPALAAVASADAWPAPHAAAAPDPAPSPVQPRGPPAA